MMLAGHYTTALPVPDAGGPLFLLPHRLGGGSVALSATASGALAEDPDTESQVVLIGQLSGARATAATGTPSNATTSARMFLQGWIRQGPEVLERLHGSYAAALWCGRRRELWLIRDHMGQVPLFVHQEPGQICFSSDLRHLRRSLQLDQPDPEALIDHLLLLPGEATRTAWGGIQRVPAAQAWGFGEDGRIRTLAHSSLAPTERTPRSDAEWVDGFREHFVRATRDRIDPGLTGAGLSGGLDSSAVAAVAAGLLNDGDLDLLAVRFPETPRSDEGPYIGAFQDWPHCRLHELTASESPLSSYRRVLDALDEPCLLQNLHLTQAVFEAASARGLSTVLDGHDGDTALARSQSERAARPRATPAPWWRRAWHAWRRPAAMAPALKLLRPGVRRQYAAAERLAAHQKQAEQAAVDPVRNHLQTLNNGFPAYASERIAVIAGEFGISTGHPFYDRELLRWSVASPGTLKWRDGYSRWILRAALTGILPEAIRQRPDKASLAPQFHQRFLTRDGADIEALIEARPESVAQWVDFDALTAAWHLYRGNPTAEPSAPIWAVVSLADWYARIAGSDPA